MKTYIDFFFRPREQWDNEDKKKIEQGSCWSMFGITWFFLVSFCSLAAHHHCTDGFNTFDNSNFPSPTTSLAQIMHSDTSLGFFYFFISSLLIQATSAQWGDVTLPPSTTLQQWPRPITPYFHSPNNAFWCVFGPMVSFFYLFFSFFHHQSKPPQLNKVMWCYHHPPPCNNNPDSLPTTSMAQMMSLGLW